MTRRLLAILVALTFLFAAASAGAQFGPLKKKKEEKPAEKKEEKKEEPATTTSSTSTVATKAVNWTENGITFEVPGNWQQMVMQRDIASFMQIPAEDSAGLNTTISRMGGSFPAENSLKATRDDAARKKQNKEYVSFEDYNIGKVKGVMWIEAEKASPDDVRRMTWTGFQKKNGWNQVIVHLSSKSGAFSKYEATFRKVLASLKVESE